MKNEPLSGPVCDCCGVHLEPKTRALTLELPDPVWDLDAADRKARTEHAKAALKVAGLGTFCPLRIPLQLTDGFEMTFHAWFQPDDSKRALAAKVGEEVTGTLASQFPPWTREILSKPVRAQAEGENRFVLTGSPDEKLDRLTKNEWPHALILGNLPEALR